MNIEKCVFCKLERDENPAHQYISEKGHEFVSVRDYRDKFDMSLGKIDRAISEFMCLAKGPLDQADVQTIKHHADDLIGAGKSALSILGITSQS